MSEINSKAAPRPDTRTGLFKAIALAGDTLVGVTPDKLEAPTPCPDYNVRQMGRHMIAVLRRVSIAAGGGNPFSLPSFADDTPDADWIKAWDTAAAEAEEAWSDPGVLGKTLSLGFTTLPGVAAAVAYTTEITLHTWDLSKATGQSPAWEPSVLAPSLGAMQHAVPAQPRGGMVPFGPVVEVAADAPAIDKLAGWYGRKP